MTPVDHDEVRSACDRNANETSLEAVSAIADALEKHCRALLAENEALRARKARLCPRCYGGVTQGVCPVCSGAGAVLTD